MWRLTVVLVETGGLDRWRLESLTGGDLLRYWWGLVVLDRWRLESLTGGDLLRYWWGLVVLDRWRLESLTGGDLLRYWWGLVVLDRWRLGVGCSSTVKQVGLGQFFELFKCWLGGDMSR